MKRAMRALDVPKKPCQARARSGEGRAGGAICVCGSGCVCVFSFLFLIREPVLKVGSFLSLLVFFFRWVVAGEGADFDLRQPICRGGLVENGLKRSSGKNKKKHGRASRRCC